MKFDKIPPIRFVLLNWVLISFISPLLLLLYTIIQREEPLFKSFDFGMIFIYFFGILWSMAFSFFSVFIFGLLAFLLNNTIDNEKVIKSVLIFCIWPIIHYTFILYVQDGFLEDAILTATLFYWAVSVFTIWFIPLNKD